MRAAGAMMFGIVYPYTRYRVQLTISRFYFDFRAVAVISDLIIANALVIRIPTAVVLQHFVDHPAHLIVSRGHVFVK
jgi:hypothetical protein